jgi:hypothetical protein
MSGGMDVAATVAFLADGDEFGWLLHGSPPGVFGTETLVLKRLGPDLGSGAVKCERPDAGAPSLFLLHYFQYMGLSITTMPVLFE